MDNLDFLYSLFNQYVFQDAKNNIEHLEYYFNLNPATTGNTLVHSLLDVIKTRDLNTIDEPLFYSILTRDKKNATEINKIMESIRTWKKYDKIQISPQRDFLKDICADSLMRKAQYRLGTNNPYELFKTIKNASIKLDDSDTLNSTILGDLDINSMVADTFTSGYPSYFPWINDLFEPAHQYESGQMVMISCPPGTGKTLWMMTEALSMAINTKEKINYLAMGDMKPKDFVIRMGSIFSGMPFGETVRNLNSVFTSLKNYTGDRLTLSVVPAASITIDEYVDFVLSNGFKIVFIDYDSNFLMKSSENMYNDFGEVYNKLTKLTQEGILVFIAAQPKIQSWTNPVIELGDIGESSRKIHTVDILFTAGKFIDSPNHLGIFKCCKNRRGEEGVSIGYIRLNNGRFKFIPVDLAKQLASNTQKRFYTDSDIDNLVLEYSKNLGAINKTINNSNNVQQQNSTINNPFSNKP